MSTVTYHRAQHAAHYGFSHPAKGHDLEQWTYAQPQRLPVPAGVPSDAEYHVGFLKNGVQHWVYHRRAPLTGSCTKCESK